METSSASGPRLRPIRTRPISSLAEPRHGLDPDDAEAREPLTPASRVFCTPTFNVHIVVAFGFASPCNIDAFKEGMKGTLLKHRRFHSVVREGDGGKLYWVPTRVNIDDHVIVISPEASEADSPTFVEDYMADLVHAPPLDMSKPLFEFHIVKAKLGDAVENVIMRVHHSMGDGTSLMSLVLACTRRVDEPESLPTLPLFKKKRIESKAGLWRRSFFLLWRFILMLWYTLHDICIFLATCLWLKDCKSFRKGCSGIEKLPRQLVHSTVSFDDIHHVKQAANATVNDVMYGMVVAGLSRYFWENHDINSKSMDKHDKRKALPYFQRRIRACALMNTRPTPGLHDIQSMMRGGSDVRWGNEMGYVILPFHLSGFKDPLQCVHDARKLFSKKKLSLGALFGYRSGALLMKLTGVEMPTKLTYRCVENTTFAYSNVIGPLEEIQFFGHRITHIIPSSIGQPQAMCVHIISYMGRATIVVSVAKEIFPDAHNIVKYMTEALKEMKTKCST